MILWYVCLQHTQSRVLCDDVRQCLVGLSACYIISHLITSLIISLSFLLPVARLDILPHRGGILSNDL